MAGVLLSVSALAMQAGAAGAGRPVTLDAKDIGKSITEDPATLRFSLDGLALKPFHETYGPHSVYLHVRRK